MVFKCLKEVNLKIKLSKCQFFEKNLHYPGHLISEGCIQLLLEKVTAVQKLKEPSNIDKLFHFLSLTGYYRKFIPLFTNVTEPLNKLLKKDTKFQLSQQYQAAFEHHEKVLCRETILQCPHMEKLYTLFTDTSHYTYSGILTQAVESPEDLRPIAYATGTFSDTQ